MEYLKDGYAIATVGVKWIGALFDYARAQLVWLQTELTGSDAKRK